MGQRVQTVQKNHQIDESVLRQNNNPKFIHIFFHHISFSLLSHLIIGTLIAMIAKNVRVMKTVVTVVVLSSLTVILWMIWRTSVSPW